MYDIIGDIHGNADALKSLLLRMGYSKKNGYYSHANRKAVFTGDLVNRGSKVRQTIKLVRRMVENKAAYAVLGNHEYNLICYHTRSLGSGYLKKHNSANRSLLYYTTKAFKDHPDEWDAVMRWIKQLPLFLEFEHFRVVHACWDSRIVKFVRRNLPGHIMNEAFLHNSAREGTIENEVVGVLLSGIEVPVDKLTTVINSTGKPVDTMRIKWWMDPDAIKLSKVAFGEYRIQPDRQLTKKERASFVPYPENKRPVFIGHYCLKGEPGLQSPNICCVDYCYCRKGHLVAYRMEGESRLKQENLVAISC